MKEPMRLAMWFSAGVCVMYSLLGFVEAYRGDWAEGLDFAVPAILWVLIYFKDRQIFSQDCLIKSLRAFLHSAQDANRGHGHR